MCCVEFQGSRTLQLTRGTSGVLFLLDRLLVPGAHHIEGAPHEDERDQEEDHAEVRGDPGEVACYGDFHRQGPEQRRELDDGV